MNKLNRLVVPALMAILLAIGATSITFAKSPEVVPSCENELGRLSGRSTALPVLPRLAGPDAGVIVDFAELTVDEIAALFGVTEYKSTNAQGQTFYTQVGSDIYTSLPVTSTAGEPVGDIKIGFRYVALGNGRVTTQFGYLLKPEGEVQADAAQLAQCVSTSTAAEIRGSQDANRIAERQQHREEREQVRQEQASKNALASAQGNTDGNQGRGGSQRSRGTQADNGGHGKGAKIGDNQRRSQGSGRNR